ncbi:MULTISPECIES: hypothetical protein [Brevundimonas]|uniref:hypothetical protein n=1 Tax=Brevundimonas TaxID=41275 RepID=UPI00190593D3|nr:MULTISPECIES: hypothetical protein [Brevundimonas]MDA0742799.1 hypothetical protein [Pseudomonadota bacterium]MBK1970783.1 hypothetical protein [Brevundimonas diminuta]MBK1974271.1 hypothetical protein [Brevundimonas diminuta]MDA1321856.1 hypothetical protein [Pseudomonadota bacterium]MDM8353369.1 hypothetical protein [Brevundimonas diminuta]
MLYTSAPLPALIDRLVIDEAQPEARDEPRRVNGLAEKQRWVLLGEPGSGKSATFEQAAVADGTSALTARAFLEGARPLGDTLFLDAVEEYRIGDTLTSHRPRDKEERRAGLRRPSPERVAQSVG